MTNGFQFIARPSHYFAEKRNSSMLASTSTRGFLRGVTILFFEDFVFRRFQFRREFLFTDMTLFYLATKIARKTVKGGFAPDVCHQLLVLCNRENNRNGYAAALNNCMFLARAQTANQAAKITLHLRNGYRSLYPT